MSLLPHHSIGSDRDIIFAVEIMLFRYDMILMYLRDYRPDHHQGAGYRYALAGPEPFRVGVAGHDQ